MLNSGSEFVWLWLAIEPENREILELAVFIEKNILIAEDFYQV